MVPAVCAALSLVPLGLVCWLDLDKLNRWKLEQEEMQHGDRSLDEPLLAEGDEAAQLKPAQLAAPYGSVLEEGKFLDGSELRTAGGSSRVDA